MKLYLRAAFCVISATFLVVDGSGSGGKKGTSATKLVDICPFAKAGEIGMEYCNDGESRIPNYTGGYLLYDTPNIHIVIAGMPADTEHIVYSCKLFGGCSEIGRFYTDEFGSADATVIGSCNSLGRITINTGGSTTLVSEHNECN